MNASVVVAPAGIPWVRRSRPCRSQAVAIRRTTEVLPRLDVHSKQLQEATASKDS